MNDLLRISNLEKHYDGFSLQDITLSVPAGSVVGFIGSNGAGKTTTIKAALGLIIPDGGTIDLLGERVFPGAPASRAAHLKQRVGVVFDACSFPEEMSVKSVGSLMSYSYNMWDKSAFDHLAAQFNLPMDKTVKDLSRGMGMKLSLACALAHHPDLLILDEATAGLDPLARDEALDALRLFMDGTERGILMSSHITSDLEKIADYIVCINEGRIVFIEERDAICDRAGIAHCRAAEFDTLAEGGFFAPGQMHFKRNAYSTDVLVFDRFAFAENYHHIAVDHADIDSYMALMLRGDIR